MIHNQVLCFVRHNTISCRCKISCILLLSLNFLRKLFNKGTVWQVTDSPSDFTDNLVVKYTLADPHSYGSLQFSYLDRIEERGRSKERKCLDRPWLCKDGACDITYLWDDISLCNSEVEDSIWSPNYLPEINQNTTIPLQRVPDAEPEFKKRLC